MSDLVEVQTPDTSKKNSEIIDRPTDEATVAIGGANDACYWNDQEFRSGEQVSYDGNRYECCLGSWIKKGG